jgi:Family of unknown function (DUF5995)
MPSTAYATLDDVVAGLAAWEEAFRSRQDRRCIFLTLYGVVSSEMREQVARNAFLDSRWVHRYAVAFANLYREALEAYEAGRIDDVPKAWRLCFDAARAGSGLVLQDLLLGVNAHVNNDLPLALTRISIDPDREQRRRDHDAVNAVLAAVMQRAVERLTALYAPGFAALDQGAGELDEMLSLFSLEVARDSAWESALSLANARSAFESGLAGRLISSRAAVLARLLLAPSRNPVFIRASSRLEQGSSWLTLVTTVKSDIVESRI